MRRQKIRSIGRRFAPKTTHFAFSYADDLEETARLVLAPETPCPIAEIPGRLEPWDQPIGHLCKTTEGLDMFAIFMRQFGGREIRQIWEVKP